MLHLLSGDAALPAFRAAGLPGEALPWREMLAEGPVPGGLDTPEQRATRAAWLTQRYAAPPGAPADGVAPVLERLAKGVAGDVVLWFDDDLFCQANLLFLLQLAPPDAHRWAVARGTHGGRPSVEDLRARFTTRRPLGAQAFADARAAWQAYTAPEPTALATLLRRDLAVPGLAMALPLHLARFPDPQRGLDPVEFVLLQGVAAGTQDLPSLFRAVRAGPGHALGWGDLQVARLLLDLGKDPSALLRVDGAPAEMPAPGAPMPRWRFGITEAGRAVLDGGADRVALQGIDRWLGGVHLQGKGPVWRWDAARGALVQR